MKKVYVIFRVVLAVVSQGLLLQAHGMIYREYPLGKPGLTLSYKAVESDLPSSVVRNIEVSLGAVEEHGGIPFQWLRLVAEKADGNSFSLWMLTSDYPDESSKMAQNNMLMYILKAGDSKPVVFANRANGSAVLPNTGAWKYLLPRLKKGGSPLLQKEKEVKYLGLVYTLKSRKESQVPVVPEEVLTISLTPDLLIGVPHHSKMKGETRKYDDSEYEYVELTRENYSEMIDNGINVLNVNAKQAGWIMRENVYYWGVGGEDVSYPECLYESNYLGPAIFFDEPMVHTRDQVVRPRFREDAEYRKAITPQLFFEEFKKEFHKAKYEGSPTQLLKGLANRKDVNIGDMDFLQQNIYSWETMVSSALYQLSEGKQETPSAMVFEPPGRFGAKRVLPELNMSFDCQIPVDDPNNLTGIIKGFLRGAARVTDKDWGLSVYGQVVRSDTYWMMTHAYDEGASHFFFWDSHRLAAVPYHEYLSLSKHLREHAESFPFRDMEKLKKAAEVAILIPPGYNLGHVKMGIGNISGVPELNLERENGFGVSYRKVMSNFLIEIERCIRLGVAYDLFWNLENLKLDQYREVITIRDDGKVSVEHDGETTLLESARVPDRPGGTGPQLSVDVKREGTGVSAMFKAKAEVVEGSAPVYYTQGADSSGIYKNAYVLWELYGPEEEDYTDFWYERWKATIEEEKNSAMVTLAFKIEKPGKYRLRVSSVDVAGRSTVVWKDITVEK